jgi:uncharacterized membrane protein YfcA
MIGVAALALVSGLLIGCIGIGGVLLVPCLSLAGVDVHAAIGASMFSYIFSGIISLFLYARYGSIEWRPAGWLAIGAAPGAFFGSILAAHTSSQVLLILVGVTVVFAGWRLLRRQGGKPERGPISLAPPLLVSVAAGVGTASAITGTGGPVLLVPLLLWWGVPVLASIGLSQAIQVPIAFLASAGNVWTGNLDLPLSAVLSVGVALGSAAGARVAHAMPIAFLSRAVAIALVIVGVLVAVRSGYSIAKW